MDGATTKLYKNEFMIDIKLALSGETIPTSNRWTEKEAGIRRDLIWGAGPSAIENITKGEINRPGYNQYRKITTTFQRLLLHAQTEYISQPRGFLLGKTRRKRNPGTPEEHWRKLVSLEKNCEFKDIKQEDLLISKFITSITDEKLREKLIREKTLNIKTTMDLVTQDSYEKRQTIHDTCSTRERESSKTGTNTENTQKLPTKQKHTPEDQHKRKTIADSAGNKTGHHHINAQQRRQNATTATNWDTLQEYAAVIPKRQE